MTLQDRIVARIQADGPMRLSDYMAMCLTHPTLGYYTTQDPLGVAGDFTTAPEISQMFGELIGLSLAQAWLDQGAPTPFTLAELGPGRGTLMADALRATQGIPGFHAAAQITLIEASPPLCAAQAKALKGHDPLWMDTADDLPDQPLFLFANEFFDALPIRQFQRDGAGWRERLVGLHGNDLSLGLGSVALCPAFDHRMADTKDGDLVEHCAAALPVISALATRIATHGGAALIVDYGDWHSLGDTLQAVKDHAPIGVLDTPGQADLTAHVDFELLAQSATANGCAYSRLTPQGVFLERLGITQRAQNLAAPLGGASLEALISAHRRLTHPAEMGNLFKVLGLYPARPEAAPPPGLDP